MTKEALPGTRIVGVSFAASTQLYDPMLLKLVISILSPGSSNSSLDSRIMLNGLDHSPSYTFFSKRRLLFAALVWNGTWTRSQLSNALEDMVRTWS